MYVHICKCSRFTYTHISLTSRFFGSSGLRDWRQASTAGSPRFGLKLPATVWGVLRV